MDKASIETNTVCMICIRDIETFLKCQTNKLAFCQQIDNSKAKDVWINARCKQA